MSRIEHWTHQLLVAEAHKRGIPEPETRSRAQLLRAIVQHDYSARQSLRGARQLVGSLLDGATQALPRALPLPSSLLGGLGVLGTRGDKARHGASLTPGQDAAHAAKAFQENAPSADPGRAHTPPSSLQLHRQQGQIELKWQLNPHDIERARRVLGYPGELALRVITVRADLTHVVRSEVTEHGPLDPSGAWLMALPGVDASCVGSIGVRRGEQFISIVHQSSRVAPALADAAGAVPTA